MKTLVLAVAFAAVACGSCRSAGGGAAGGGGGGERAGEASTERREPPPAPAAPSQDTVERVASPADRVARLVERVARRAPPARRPRTAASTPGLGVLTDETRCDSSGRRQRCASGNWSTHDVCTVALSGSSDYNTMCALKADGQLDAGRRENGPTARRP